MAELPYINEFIFIASTETSRPTQLFEKCVIVAGTFNGATRSNDVIKIHLRRPDEISIQEQMPSRDTINMETVAGIYCNTMYLTGIGINEAEIWKYNNFSGWMKCASLVQGRRRHSAAFIDEVLYICGGFVNSSKRVLDSVEAFDAITDKCTTVGKLVHCVQNSGNCVPFRSSVYIFGGADKDGKDFNYVQMYNTNENTCSVLSTPMPRPTKLMRAALWKTSVILLGDETCLILNLETETWQEREQFKTGVFFFGVVLDNERVFVIGGGIYEKDKEGNSIWKCRDDVRYVPLQNILDDKPIEWKIHAKLPTPSFAYSVTNMRILV